MATTYTTQAGDSLWSIAQQFYGDGAQWNAIHEANRNVISDPNAIQAGWTLNIPDLSAPQPPTPHQTYTTVAGDTLWSIAQRFYGDGSQWERIYTVNQSVIGPDSNALMAGVTLTIPGS